MRKRMLLAAVILAGAANLKAQITEVSGFQNPESVIAHKKHLFVSNMGAQLDPKAKDGDGYISMLSRDSGIVKQERYITGLNSPKGMLVRGCKLFIADVDRVVAYNIKNRKKVWEVSLSSEGVLYANDITGGCGKIIVSATDKNTIYKICRSGKIKKMTVDAALPGVNGLQKKCCKLFVANYGRGTDPDGSIGWIHGKKFVELKNAHGIFDGIGKVCGMLVVSDWGSTTESKGRLVTYYMHKKIVREVNLGRSINGPADIYIDKCKKRIWIPAMRENKVLSIPLSKIKESK
ncbi:MAG: hypothetical protein U0V74_06300 [Chitinophagales bacterium]